MMWGVSAHLLEHRDTVGKHLDSHWSSIKQFRARFGNHTSWTYLPTPVCLLLNPFPSLNLGARFRGCRAFPTAPVTSGDRATATGPVGMINLAISKP